MLARSRFGQYGNTIYCFQNWHLKDTPIFIHFMNGYPYYRPCRRIISIRTGISAVRIAIADIIKKTKKESASFSFSSSKKRTSNRHQ
jgi:hypothetical protein